MRKLAKAIEHDIKKSAISISDTLKRIYSDNDYPGRLDESKMRDNPLQECFLDVMTESEKRALMRCRKLEENCLEGLLKDLHAMKNAIAPTAFHCIAPRVEVDAEFCKKHLLIHRPTSYATFEAMAMQVDLLAASAAVKQLSLLRTKH